MAFPFRQGLWAAVFVALWCTYFLLQRAIPEVYGVDPYYHLKVAEIYRDEGVIQEFPWAERSLFAEGFADKELLFHLLLIPFLPETPGDFRAPKAFAALLAVCVYAAFAWSLHALGCRHTLLFTVLLFLISPSFISRTLLLRPHLLNIVVTILIVPAVLSGKALRVFPLALLLGLSYSVPVTPFLVGGVVAAGDWMFSRRARLRPLLGAAAGFCVSLVVHPHFPKNLAILYFQAKHVVANALFSRNPLLQADEMLSAPTRDYLLLFWPVLLLLAIAFIHVARNPGDRPARSMFLAASLFFSMSLWSLRFIELSVPFSVGAGALAITKHLPRRLSSSPANA